MTDRKHSLAARFRCEPRFESRRVPTIEVWASGPDFVFQRMAGVVDSGATLTLLGRGAYELLGVTRNTGIWDELPGLSGSVRYELHPVQFRLHVADGPQVAVRLRVGFCEAIYDNLFGADLLDYFTVSLSRSDVTFLAD